MRPRPQQYIFLLGNEKKLPRWNDANKWSDFGGSPKKNESESECAGREFHEETVAAVRWDDKENDQRNFFVRQSNLPIIRDLEKGNFSFKMITLIDDDRYYATYVKQVLLTALSTGAPTTSSTGSTACGPTSRVVGSTP